MGILTGARSLQPIARTSIYASLVSGTMLAGGCLSLSKNLLSVSGISCTLSNSSPALSPGSSDMQGYSMSISCVYSKIIV